MQKLTYATPEQKAERAWQVIQAPDGGPYLIGHFGPEDHWHKDSEKQSLAAARSRVAILNGRLSLYVYEQRGHWVVGWYDEEDRWHQWATCDTQERAAAMVIELNEADELINHEALYRLTVESFVSLEELHEQQPWLAEAVLASPPGGPLEINAQMGMIRYKLTTE